MSYLITAVLLIFIIGLIILFRSSRRQRPEEVPEQEDTVHQTAVEEPEAAQEPVAGTTGEEQIVTPVAEEEEFVELSLESSKTGATERFPEEEEFAEISLDMGEVESPEEVKRYDLVKEADSDVIPALAGSSEQGEIAVEETPAELAEKLNFYFGEDGDISPRAEDEATKAEEEEILLEEPVLDALVGEEKFIEEIKEPELPAVVSRDGYAAELQNLETRIRLDLRNAIKNRDTENRAVLEYMLQAVCEKLAGLEESYSRQIELIETAEKFLGEVQDNILQSELPGIDLEKARKELRIWHFDQVESMLSEVSLQLEHGSELTAGVYALCGQLAEERLDYESGFEDYRNANAADPENDEYLLAAGRIARILGRNKDAKSWLEKLVRQGLETNEQSLVQALAQHELAVICVREGQKEKAGALLKRALEIGETMLGKGHPDLGPIMHDYAALYESNGMYEQAEALYTTALKAMENKWGGDYPKLASTLNRLAGLYEEMERGEKALPLYERALTIKERVLGKNHHDVGAILNNLADLLRRQGKLEQAEPMFKRSLEIAENELGKDHPNLTVVLNNMAELYSQMGREEEAAEYQGRAFSLFGLPGMDGDFVEIEKDDISLDNDEGKTIAGK